MVALVAMQSNTTLRTTRNVRIMSKNPPSGRAHLSPADRAVSRVKVVWRAACREYSTRKDGQAGTLIRKVDRSADLCRGRVDLCPSVIVKVWTMGSGPSAARAYLMGSRVRL